MSEDPPPKMRPNAPSDLSRTDAQNQGKPLKDEGNLLIEAVALLVQRQRETESWVAEQIWQAEERASATDRRYAELNQRLEGIEAHLRRLVHDIEPPRGEVSLDDRLARLREQMEGLKSGADAAPLRSTPWPSLSARPNEAAAMPQAPPPAPWPTPAAEAAVVAPPRAAQTDTAAEPAEVAVLRGSQPIGPNGSMNGAPAPQPVQPAAIPDAGARRKVTFWDLLGATPQERFGVVLIGAGAVAILFAILTQLRFS